MRIKSIDVSNFRALRNATLNFSPTTALIGENNSGKSAFLN
ncbi:MAG: AAA family ATPase, partial [Afipia sp.]|nr:AAA family ATPase [Afipia sp.]